MRQENLKRYVLLLFVVGIGAMLAALAFPFWSSSTVTQQSGTTGHSELYFFGIWNTGISPSPQFDPLANMPGSASLTLYILLAMTVASTLIGIAVLVRLLRRDLLGTTDRTAIYAVAASIVASLTPVMFSFVWPLTLGNSGSLGFFGRTTTSMISVSWAAGFGWYLQIIGSALLLSGTLLLFASKGLTRSAQTPSGARNGERL